MVRYFYTHKRGETYNDIQDSIQVNEQVGRFAVSDGVTNSFIPEILSRILTKAFVSSGIEGFPPSNLQEVFSIEREAYLSTLDEDHRFLQEMVEEEFKDSAATFVGIELSDFWIKWIVIGDSCLFIQPDNGLLSCYCSNESYWDNDNNLHVAFDSRPARVLSSGEINGKIIKGELEIPSCWIVLASDAMSAWIIDAYNNKRDPLSLLSQISDNEDFEHFVNNEYTNGNLKSDDESIVLIRINNPEEHETSKSDNASPDSLIDVRSSKELDCIKEPDKPSSIVANESNINNASIQDLSEIEHKSEANCISENDEKLSTAPLESPLPHANNNDLPFNNQPELAHNNEFRDGFSKLGSRIKQMTHQVVKHFSGIDSDNKKTS